ncbi:hypothetical protein H0H92_000188 [Tricholoma furcatifolium]|nr:hypothetical protein H0H92_000188 [Tricholoma furcatifolium]
MSTSKATSTPIDFPVGPEPGWEFEEEEGQGEHKSILESRVLLQALRQSREKWMYSVFPRFSTKARGGKASDPPPPPHTIQARGKCDLIIGPHVFPETTFYEVHYLPSQPASVVGSSTGFQTKTPYGSFPQSSSTNTTSNAANYPTSEHSSNTPQAPPLASVTTITPALISQVNAAASSNPTLANLLQLAAAGMATPEQLKTLGIFIQSLATAESAPHLAPSVVTPPAPLPPSSISTGQTTATSSSPLPFKEFDLVFEFRENNIERWLFPRGVVACERVVNMPAASASSQTIIKASLPFPRPNVSNSVSPEQATLTSLPVHEPQVVTFILEATPLAVWDTILRWIGSPEISRQNEIKLQSMASPKEHHSCLVNPFVQKPIDPVYLRYHLTEGPLLTQLQTVSGPQFTMKSLKTIALTATRSKRRSTNKSKASADASNPEKTKAKESEPSKRRRVSQQIVRTPILPIQCVSCKNTDVPLILGGRFCRPCVEAGRATQSVQPSPSILPDATTLSTHTTPPVQPDTPK